MRKYIWALIGVAIALVLVAFSFCGPVYEIGQECEKAHAICTQYHLVPRVFIWLVQVTDGHEGFFAFFTGAAVATFTLGLVVLGNKADGHFRIAERAYIQMSHKGGLAVGADGLCAVQMEIKNWGHTPGAFVDRQIGGVLWSLKNPLATDPPYDQIVPKPVATAFLVPTGAVNFQATFTLPPMDVVDIIEGEVFLVVFGYIDYRDKFGDRHRAGYGRQYVPHEDGTKNLVFLTTAERYNYDRPRKRGEGPDWND